MSSSKSKCAAGCESTRLSQETRAEISAVKNVFGTWSLDAALPAAPVETTTTPTTTSTGAPAAITTNTYGAPATSVQPIPAPVPKPVNNNGKNTKEKEGTGGDRNCGICKVAGHDRRKFPNIGEPWVGPRIFLYRVMVDLNIGPNIQYNTLSLVICKPNIFLL